MGGLRQTWKWALMGGAGIVLSACAGGSKEMAMNPGSAFNETLHIGYAQLASGELAEMDYADARYFTNKSNLAGMGEVVMADTFKDRELTMENRVEAISMRSRLMSYLEGKDTMSSYPVISAKAQVANDCWLQEAEENHQPKDIVACKTEFDMQIAQLAELTKPEPVVIVAAAEPEVNMPGPVNVYFAFDSAEIDENASRTLDAFAILFNKTGAATIKVVGHTDSAGDSSYNADLGVRRAKAVRSALIERGIHGAVMMSSKGEADQQIETEDGVRERLNRRVKIIMDK